MSAAPTDVVDALTALIAASPYCRYLGLVARPDGTLVLPGTPRHVGDHQRNVLHGGVLGAFAALILKIPTQGVSILGVAIVAAVARDSGGFFIGRSMGRTPLSAISPNKTVEGLVGGVLSALVAVFFVAVLLGFGPFSAGQALVFGLFTALVDPLGDLAESLFKRDLGLKDMGSILPQHGGILDRFDGMLFVLPTAYYVCRVLGLA